MPRFQWESNRSPTVQCVSVLQVLKQAPREEEPSYSGYGGNPGRPTESGLYHDARAALEYLIDAGWARDRIVYFGESLGSAVMTRLAVEFAPGALVLRSPFIDLASAGSVHYPFLPVRALLKDRYPVAELLPQVRVPTVVVYGTRDSIVPPEQSRAVAAAAAGPTRVVVIEGADHNDRALLDGQELIDSIVELADQVRQTS